MKEVGPKKPKPPPHQKKGRRENTLKAQFQKMNFSSDA